MADGRDSAATVSSGSDGVPGSLLGSLSGSLLGSLLVLSLVAGIAVPVEGGTPTPSETRTIELTQALHLTPDTPGEIAVTLRYAIPPDVVELNTRVPPSATVTATSGFVPREGSEYAWDGRTETPTLTYRIPANETLDATGPIAGPGEYIFVDVGPWALVRAPPTSTSWSWTGGGSVGLTRRLSAPGTGAAGDRIAFLGEHREVTRTANGQTFRLVLPARAELAEPPARILDSLSATSGTLQVGDRDERVFVVAAPTRSVKWAVRGLQTGRADMWVRDGERLDTASNVWIHEYVHTRQGYAAGSEVRWFTEASATYYAALSTLEQDRITFEAFRDRLALGGRARDSAAVLADPATWDVVAPYTKGALVAGELDRRLRLATDRRQSLQSVFRRMNERDEPIDGSLFQRFVAAVGGEAVGALADRYTTTTAVPDMWNRSAHDRAFGIAPARFSYTFPREENTLTYRVSGPYREGPLAGTRTPVLATGETLTVEVRVTNTGETLGEYDAQLRVDGEPRARRTGTLAPGESRTLSFSYRFDRPGEYALTVAGERIPVTVREPATPTVAALSADLSGAEGTATAVGVTATVENEHSFPAAAGLTLFHGDGPVETRQVRLAPGETRSVHFEPIVVDPGDHHFRVGDRTIAVSVGSGPSPGEGATGAGGTTGTGRATETGAVGFGATAGLVSLGVGVVLLGRKYFSVSHTPVPQHGGKYERHRRRLPPTVPDRGRYRRRARPGRRPHDGRRRQSAVRHLQVSRTRARARGRGAGRAGQLGVRGKQGYLDGRPR